jgi:hypothetical protein
MSNDIIPSRQEWDVMWLNIDRDRAELDRLKKESVCPEKECEMWDSGWDGGYCMHDKQCKRNCRDLFKPKVIK